MILGEGQVTVKVIAVDQHGGVLIGFKAPDNIAVNRSEVYERKLNHPWSKS